MTKRFERELENARRTFAKHILTMELDTEQYKAFMLRREPGKRMDGVLIMATPEGIIISGDHSPVLRAAATCYGYGLKWFAGKLDYDYLAGKTLERGWHLDNCLDWLRSRADDMASDEAFGDKALAKEYRALAKELEEHMGSQFDFYKRMEDVDHEALYTDSPGYGYNYLEMAKLSAIQERFAKCYAELNVPA
jgi:hypothetical protein